MITDITSTSPHRISETRTTVDPVIVCATDDAYIMPLAVMLLSAVGNIRAGSQLNVFILDGGVSEENREKLKETLANQPITVRWISFDASQLERFSVSHHVSHTAYYRLLMGDVLPASIEKVIYLDCDLLVKGDLVELWQAPMKDRALLAVPDVACPYLDARNGMDNFRRSNPYLAAWRPVPNYQDLGLNPKAKYFNSGVMVIDLEKWRNERLSEKLIECMTANQSHIWCWDQYALNVVLHDRWAALPMQWNLGTHAFEFPSVEYSPVEKNEFDVMISDPKVVHFTTEWKPWHFGIRHPYRNEFFQVLDQTVWKGWRPERPAFSVKKSLDRLMVGSIKRCTIAFRKMKSIWSS